MSAVRGRGRVVLAFVLLATSACGTSAEPSLAAPSSAPLAGVTIGSASPDFGFVVCTSAPLHHCTGITPTRMGTRVTPPTDIDPVPGCGTEAAVAPLCPGTFADRTVLLCYARHGVLLDMLAITSSAPAPSDTEFVLQCDEGRARIAFIEPL